MDSTTTQRKARLTRYRRDQAAAMDALREALDEVLSGPGRPRSEMAAAIDYALDARGFVIRKIR